MAFLHMCLGDVDWAASGWKRAGYLGHESQVGFATQPAPKIQLAARAAPNVLMRHHFTL